MRGKVMSNEEIQALIQQHTCVLFMKGEKDMPQCGFSHHAVMLLKQYTDDFHTINILQDPALRENLKIYSDWPTFPQLYVRGEFIGGVDIMREMHDASELSELFAEVV